MRERSLQKTGHTLEFVACSDSCPRARYPISTIGLQRSSTHSSSDRVGSDSETGRTSSANLANQDLLVLGEILVLQHLVQLAERHLGDFARRQRQSISRRQLLVLRLTSTTSRHALNAARRQRAIVAIRSESTIAE